MDNIGYKEDHFHAMYREMPTMKDDATDVSFSKLERVHVAVINSR